MGSVGRHQSHNRSYPMAFARLVARLCLLGLLLCGAAHSRARSAASVLDPRVYLGPPDVDQTWVINENVVNFWRPGNVTERGGTVPGGLLLPQRALLVNNTLPGPPLNVVQGQLVRINIINYLLTEVVTIHWHGISQRGTPWNDGAELVTQCAVEPGAKYTYMFKVDQAGTYFWHAHTGMEQEEGVVGQLVVRASPTNPDPQAALYDDDTQPAILVHDWWRNPVGMLKAPGYLNFQNLEGTLVNGFFAPVTQATAAKLPPPPGPPRKPGGPAAPPPAPPIAPENGTWAPSSTLLPPLASDLTVFNAGADGKGNWTTYTLNLTAGKCYRLRFINANGDFAGWQVAVVGHNLTLIAKDAEDLKPQVVRSFVFYGGNRVDAVLCTNNPAGGSFPLVFSSVSQISPLCPWWPNKCQWRAQALVTYPPITPAANVTKIKTGDATADAVDGQYDRQAWKPLASRKCVPNPTRSLRMSVGFLAPPGGPSGTKSWLWTEKVAFQMPMGPTLLNGLGCTAFNNTHVEQVDSESEVLELIIDNLTDMPHPIHMHGGTFSVIDTNFYVEAAWEADIANATCPTGDVPMHSDPGWLTIANNTLLYQRFWGCAFGNTTAQRAAWAARPGCSDKPNTQASLYETDTVPLPPRSYIVLRLYNWNPGHWLFHCHTNHHMLRGMSFLLNVLPSKVPPVPDWLLPATVTNATARAAWEANGFATGGQCGPYCFGKRGTADGGPLSYSQYLKKHKPKP